MHLIYIYIYIYIYIHTYIGYLYVYLSKVGPGEAAHTEEGEQHAESHHEHHRDLHEHVGHEIGDRRGHAVAHLRTKKIRKWFGFHCGFGLEPEDIYIIYIYIYIYIYISNVGHQVGDRRRHAVAHLRHETKVENQYILIYKYVCI